MITPQFTSCQNDPIMTAIAGTSGGWAVEREKVVKCCLGDMLTEELVSTTQCLVLYVTDVGDYKSIVLGDVGTKFALGHQFISKWEAMDPRLNHAPSSFEPKYRCLNCNYNTNYLHNMRGHHFSAHPEHSSLPSQEKWTSHFHLLSKRKPEEPSRYFGDRHAETTSRHKLKEAHQCSHCNYKSMYSHNIRDHIASTHGDVQESKVQYSPATVVVKSSTSPDSKNILPDATSSIVTRSKIQNETTNPMSRPHLQDGAGTGVRDNSGSKVKSFSQTDSSLDLTDLACGDNELAVGNSGFGLSGCAIKKRHLLLSDRLAIGEYASKHPAAEVVKHFASRYANITKSSVSYCYDTYRRLVAPTQVEEIKNLQLDRSARLANLPRRSVAPKTVQHRIRAKHSNYKYTEEERMEMGKYSHDHGTSNAVNKYSTKFPLLRESTVRQFRAKYRKQIASANNVGVCDSTTEQGLASQQAANDNVVNPVGLTSMSERNSNGPVHCETCGEMFEHKKLKEIHMSIRHTRNGHYHCSYCNTDVLASSWDQHQKLHSRAAAAAVTCDLCQKSFKSARNLRDHRHEVHKEGQVYPCSMCPKVFARVRSLKSHMAWHEGNKTHICEHCGEGYSLKPSLIKHINSKHAQSTGKKINQHIPTSNGEQRKPPQQSRPPEIDQSNNCIFMPLISLAEVSIQSAAQTSPVVEPVQTKPLSKRASLPNLSALKRPRVEEEEFICEYCPHEHFPSKQGLMSHTLLHHNADEDLPVPPLSARLRLQSQFSNTPHSQLSQDLIEAAYLYNRGDDDGSGGQRQTLLLPQKSADKDDK